jgi:hypothetical protein
MAMAHANCHLEAHLQTQTETTVPTVTAFDADASTTTTTSSGQRCSSRPRCWGHCLSVGLAVLASAAEFGLKQPVLGYLFIK